MHPVHRQRLLQDCLDQKGNFMNGHLLHHLLHLPVLFFHGFHFQEEASQAKFDMILMGISCARHPTTVYETPHVPRLPTTATIVSTGGHSSHELSTTWLEGCADEYKSLLLQARMGTPGCGVNNLNYFIMFACLFLWTVCVPPNTNLSSYGFVGRLCTPKDTQKTQFQ